MKENILNSPQSKKDKIGVTIIKNIKPFFIWTSISTIIIALYLIITVQLLTIYTSLIIPSIIGFLITYIFYN